MTGDWLFNGLTERRPRAARREGPNLLPRSRPGGELLFVLEVLREPMFALLSARARFISCLAIFAKLRSFFVFGLHSVRDRHSSRRRYRTRAGELRDLD